MKDLRMFKISYIFAPPKRMSTFFEHMTTFLEIMSK